MGGTLWVGHPPPEPCLHRDGMTVLHFAALNGNAALTAALINAGASVNIQNCNG
jgi:ankyrin repeat protein